LSTQLRVLTAATVIWAAGHRPRLNQPLRHLVRRRIIPVMTEPDIQDRPHGESATGHSAPPLSSSHRRNDTGSMTHEDIEEGRAAAILAYVPFGCFVALVRFRDNPFAMKHGKQGLLLTFFELLAGIFLIPRLSEYFWVTVVFACLASAVTGIYFALQGLEWTIPIVGRWFEDHVDIDNIPRSTNDTDNRS
jgi:uncharacterized membrane protein